MSDKTSEDLESQSNDDTTKSNAPPNTNEDTPPVPDQQAPPEGEPADPVKGAAKQAETAAEAKPTTKPTPKGDSATSSVTAKSSTSSDRKEVTIMSELDDKQQLLVEAKQKLQEQLALSAKLEQDVQKLQEAEQLKQKVALNAQAAQYGKVFKDLDLTQRLSDVEGELKRLMDKIKPNAEEAKLKQVEDRRAKVDADIKARQTQQEKLKQESDQLDKDVISAGTDRNNREQELKDKKKALEDFNQTLKALEEKVANSDAAFDKDNKVNVLQTWSDVLDCKNAFDKDVKPKLVPPDVFGKDLESKQKALDDANEKLRQLKVKQAEKQAELKLATEALAAVDRDAAIKEFIALITTG